MAKIAVELKQALAGRTGSGVVGGTTRRVLAQGEGWRASDVLCTSGPQDRRFQEQHSHVCIALVTQGTFHYRSAAGQELMTPGSLLLGNAGHLFECGHEHGAGDRCLAFWYTPEYFASLAVEAGICSANPVFGRVRIPPIRELSPIFARACAGLAELREVPWEELSVRLAVQTVRLAHGLSANVVTIRRARWRE